MSRNNIVFLLILILSNIQIAAQKNHLVINEVVASNSKVFSDGFGEYDDWIEIYNTTDSSIELAGMFLTDDPEFPTKHEFELSDNYWTTIKSKGYLLLWIDNDPEQGKRRISFSMNRKGGYIALYNRDTTLIDEIYYGAQKTNQSIGRIQVDQSELAIFSQPTPNEKNENGLRLNSIEILVEISLPSGLYDESQEIKLSSSTSGAIHYTMDGSEPRGKSKIYEGPIRIDSSTVLRTRLIQEGFLPNAVSSRSYLINEKSTLSVVSLIIDPKDLWRKKKGIYRNFKKRGMEVPAYVEYFDTTATGQFNLAISKTSITRIAGKTSRR